MTVYLTSSPFVEGTPLFSEDNGFARMLLSDLPKPVRALFVASNPADVEGTE